MVKYSINARLHEKKKLKLQQNAYEHFNIQCLPKRLSSNTCSLAYVDIDCVTKEPDYSEIVFRFSERFVSFFQSMTVRSSTRGDATVFTQKVAQGCWKISKFLGSTLKVLATERQKGDMKQVRHSGYTKRRSSRHSTKFSRDGDLARGVCAPLTLVSD